ncbi:PAXIP1-associated glutamate-rich protein 1 [Periplaneta americana]|uniref:PAXIP1-associated glutamate-rich protein 1 n=1 Tax=Periplaneta americana TaxID=6978 RepID=UPI0037E847D2
MMGELTGEQDEWNIPCSDDENYNAQGKDFWEPSAEDIVSLYELIDKEGVLELEWQCPGRRVPSPAQDEFYQEDEESMESKPEEKSDFDFMDEMSSPKFTPRRTGEGGPKGSAKKKTTSLDGILSNIRRHRKLEEMEKQASESATNP